MLSSSQASFKDRRHAVSASESSIESVPSERSSPLVVFADHDRGDERGVVQGIPPIAKSTLWEGWELPGHGKPYGDCGAFHVRWGPFKGCLNVDGHNHERLDGVSCAGKVYVKAFRRSCERAVCPICYEKWAGREASRATRRLKAWCGGRRRAIHVVVSPSQEDFDSLPYERLRRKAYRIMKRVGIVGGNMIPHPFRETEDGRWVMSPHFHAVCYGWLRETADNYQESGWIVKNEGIRKTISGTLLYLLSHAGVMKGRATITWFGKLAYNKMKLVGEEEAEICPICGEKLVMLSWCGIGDPPISGEGEYFLAIEGWHRKRG